MAEEEGKGEARMSRELHMERGNAMDLKRHMLIDGVTTGLIIAYGINSFATSLAASTSSPIPTITSKMAPTAFLLAGDKPDDVKPLRNLEGTS